MFDSITITPATYVSDVDVAWTLAQAEDAERTAQAEHAQRRAAQANALAVMRRREQEQINRRAEAEREAADLRERVRQLTAEEISVSDPRLTHIWVNAAKAANEAQHCSEYDQIARYIGIPTRDELKSQGLLRQHYDVEVMVELQTYVTVCVEAADERDALAEADNMDSEDIWNALNTYNLNADSITTWDARDAEEADA